MFRVLVSPLMFQVSWIFLSHLPAPFLASLRIRVLPVSPCFRVCPHRESTRFRKKPEGVVSVPPPGWNSACTSLLISVASSAGTLSSAWMKRAQSPFTLSRP